MTKIIAHPGDIIEVADTEPELQERELRAGTVEQEVAEALAPMAPSLLLQCKARSPKGWTCTRLGGHMGAHLAHHGYAGIAFMWWKQQG